MSVSETALTIFNKLDVPASFHAKILELDPEFETRSEADQADIVGFILEQAQKTTEGVRSRFPMIKVRHAGATVFEMPKEVGDEKGKLVDEFTGAILDQYLTKAFWENEDASGTPPDCASLDALNPYVRTPVTTKDNGGCLACPNNKFGSATVGGGKRCRDAKRVIVSLDGHELPARLQLSALNIKPLDGYLNDLRDQGLTIGSVRTKFRAIEARNKGGTEYTGVELSTERPLNAVEMLALKREKLDPFKADFRQGQLEADDGGGSRSSAPDQASVEAGAQAAKASDVM